MSQKPNTEKETNAALESQPNQPPPIYPNHTAAKSRWMWLIPFILITLGVGIMVGRFWAHKQATKMDTDDALLMNNNAQDANAVSAQKPVLTVEIITPQQAVIENALTAEGTIEPKNIATVNAKVTGVSLEQVLVEEGDKVTKGQLLARFDTDAMEHQANQAKADLMEAETRFELAQADANRVLPLLEIKAISQQEVDRFVATANQAAASVAAAKARLNNQNLNLTNAEVKAPVSGIISEKTANVGSVPGQAPLFTIIENGQLEWQAQVDPNKLGDVTVGTPVRVSLPRGKTVVGKVTRIAPTADRGSRQVSVYATLANTTAAKAGMYQRGTFILGGETNQVVPVSAIVTQDGYDYVMVVNHEQDENGETLYRVQRQKVSIGDREGDQVVLNEALSPDVAIVRQGGSFLNDGDIVRVAKVGDENLDAATTSIDVE